MLLKKENLLKVCSNRKLLRRVFLIVMSINRVFLSKKLLKMSFKREIVVLLLESSISQLRELLVDKNMGLKENLCRKQLIEIEVEKNMFLI